MKSEQAFKLVSDYVCAGQLQLAQYAFISNQKHKNLKKALSEWHTLAKRRFYPKEKLVEARELVKTSFSALEEFLNCEFYSAFLDSYSFFTSQGYLTGRSELKPRMCIKVMLGSEIVTLFRSPVLQNHQEKPIGAGQNTAFRKVIEGDPYYLSNNIPQEVFETEYANARIDQDRAIRYYTEKSKQREDGFVSRESERVAWAKCWTDYSEGASIDFFYRSTLVIPISLSTDKMHEDFRSKFDISTDAERAIFGFLCFDHVDTNFFEEKDKYFGQILADFLSLYLIQQLFFTTFSSAYFAAARLIYSKKLEASLGI
jgi:hypothetical protein